MKKNPTTIPPPVNTNRNVLTSPVWVPPKPLHRPVYEAPGMIVREKLTGQVLHG